MEEEKTESCIRQVKHIWTINLDKYKEDDEMKGKWSLSKIG
jgi:hypothetical protein